MTDKDRAISRVRKLRALGAADSGATGPERQSANRRADKLMAKHGLLPHDIVGARPHPRPAPYAPQPASPGVMWFSPSSASGNPAPFTVYITFT